MGCCLFISICHAYNLIHFPNKHPFLPSFLLTSLHLTLPSCESQHLFRFSRCFSKPSKTSSELLFGLMLMATAPFAHFPTSPVICSASPQPNHPKHNPTRQKSSPSPSNWWPPLFGWSSDPDYIQGSNSKSNQQGGEIPGHPERETWGRPTRSKFGLGCFTEEKAKELRKKTMETSTFHDIMYHSAIASRRASDVSASGRRPQER